MSDTAIEVSGLTHHYGRRTLYRDLEFRVPRGKVVALLGKNGVGKTTLIRLLMGFLRPAGGHCRVLGEDSHALSPATRARIGLLFEGHLTYDFMTIEQIERFHRPFYPNWRHQRYYDLVDRMQLPRDHRIANMSCGQRSQVVLGLIFAQDPELMILDDYSMGLDAGYRRLFLDYLTRYLDAGERTVFLTSHVVQDMEELVDEVIFLQRGGELLQMPLADFRRDFRCFALTPGEQPPPPADRLIRNLDLHGRQPRLYSFAERDRIAARLAEQWPGARLGEVLPMTLEDAFIGLTGKY
ncbi:ABC transporter ATP-binding protein [Marichromatium gracile]|uniref:ABC transporter ATP-binding protein n=1 Tax=Marichromatium gracile TaxID=1048 RepID=UPI001F2B1B9B|nr:ABC transporter ATP-binding protein [Marichromatium gracile]MCF1183381.1 ABC transporter ATP-binding protein [Marichromatium gracile]